MTLNNLITRASAAYPDGVIATEYWDFKRERPRKHLKGGDTLALFIACELADTFDPDAGEVEQLRTAVRALERARFDLGSLSATLANAIKP